MGNSTTTTPDGDVLSVTTTVPQATISFGRKNGLPNYSNEEMSIFVQVPLDGIDINDAEAVEKFLDPHAAFAKAYVYKQLGNTYGVDEGNGVVKAVEAEATQVASGKARTNSSSKRSGSAGQSRGASSDKAELWERLALATPADGKFKTADGETVWDNRENKRNPKGPDFKFADSGDGLWLDKAPDGFVVPGDEEVI